MSPWEGDIDLMGGLRAGVDENMRDQFGGSGGGPKYRKRGLEWVGISGSGRKLLQKKLPGV